MNCHSIHPSKHRTFREFCRGFLAPRRMWRRCFPRGRYRADWSRWSCPRSWRPAWCSGRRLRAGPCGCAACSNRLVCTWSRSGLIAWCGGRPCTRQSAARRNTLQSTVLGGGGRVGRGRRGWGRVNKSQKWTNGEWLKFILQWKCALKTHWWSHWQWNRRINLTSLERLPERAHL